MNTSAAHYDTHLGPVYAWMLGDLEAALARSRAELEDLDLPSPAGRRALDLGAGLGLHSLALARRGFEVTAIDSCRVLLDELRSRAVGLPITAIDADIQQFRSHVPHRCEAIVCLGDTLTHLPSMAAVESLLTSIAATLSDRGMFAATFRDYVSAVRSGERRSILVKRDTNRILHCVLEYGEEHVAVHDHLTERNDHRWVRRVSSYRKLRLSPDWVAGKLQLLGLTTRRETAPSGMIRIVARAARDTNLDSPGNP